MYVCSVKVGCIIPGVVYIIPKSSLYSYNTLCLRQQVQWQWLWKTEADGSALKISSTCTCLLFWRRFHCLAVMGQDLFLFMFLSNKFFIIASILPLPPVSLSLLSHVSLKKADRQQATISVRQRKWTWWVDEKEVCSAPPSAGDGAVFHRVLKSSLPEIRFHPVTCCKLDSGDWY